MRSRGAPVLAVLLLAAGCGGDGGTSTPGADRTIPTSTATVPRATAPTIEPATPETTIEPATPETTSAPTIDTMVEPASTEMAVLRSDGLGSVDFGAPAEQALAELTRVLGTPDRVEPIGPGGECVEGAGWLECVRELRIVDSGQLAVWDGYDLEVALVDTTRDVWPREQTPLQFGDWHSTASPDDARLVTEEGLYAGMTVGELRAAAPWVEFTDNEGLLDSFSVTFGAAGGYWGRLDWVPATNDIDRSDVAAVQEALNDHGADLVVDGEWGPNTEAAWLTFLTDRDIEPFTPQLWLTPEIGAQLGLPPDDIIIATLEPRPAIAPVDSVDQSS